MSFLNEDYNVPASGSNYMKLEKGDNQFRILSSAIVGWECWTSEIVDGKEIKKPNRFRKEDSIPISMIDPNNMPKHFWAMVVYNYQDNKVQILELTQRSVQKEILSLTRNKKWGDPKNYDIIVNRTGEGMETRYTTMPNPPEAISPEIEAKYSAMTINLEALYDGGDPFATTQEEDIKPVDDPFAEPPPRE